MTILAYRTGSKPRGKFAGVAVYPSFGAVVAATTFSPYFYRSNMRFGSMFKNGTGQKVKVFAFDKSTNALKTGDAANITAYIQKDNGSVTVLTDTSATELDATNAPGVYSFDISATETNADEIVVTGKSSTSNVVVLGMPAIIYTLPTNFTAFSLTAGGLVNGTVSDKTGFALTSAYDFAKGTVAVTESYNVDGAAPTPVQALMLMLQLLTESSVSGTTLTIKKLDGSTTAATLTLNDASTPTSATRAS